MRAAGLVLSGVLAVAGCSGVPSSTTPQVVRTLQVNTPSASPAPPAPNADRREIVSGFLRNNGGHDTSHLAAQQYLDKAAAQAWKPGGAQILDAAVTSLPARDGSVTVRGTEVGDVNGGGTFSLPSGSQAVSQTFRFKQTSLGWRITNPPSVLLVPADDFDDDYQLMPLYFFNTAQTVLVPDLRYSSAEDQSLADWLLVQLLAGPQNGSLANLPNVFPSQIDQKTAKVTLGQPIVVQLPGVKSVTPANRLRIAAELAYTFQKAFPERTLQIQDGTAIVALPSGQTTFSTATLPASFASPASAADQTAYYIRDHEVFSSSGRRATDTVGGSRGGVASVAAASLGRAIPLIATVSTDGRTVFIDNSTGSRPVNLAAAARSRPEWTRDGSTEVWLGVGRALDRVTSTGAVRPVPISTVQGASPLAPKAVTAVRFSPDGARVALVLAGVGSGASSSAWLGNVVRSGNAVSVQGLHQFSPPSWHVRDLAWTNAVGLEVIDNAPNAFEFAIYSVRCDGSGAEQVTNQDLPAAPRYITVGRDGTTWVSVGEGSSATLWQQSGGAGWTAPFGRSSYVGSAPAYSS
jgi:Lipoprotein LpqB beta-propeller domain